MSNLIRLGDHTTKVGSGQTPSGGYRSYSQTGIPLIRSQNVLMGAFSDDGLVYISQTIDDSMSGSRVLGGDVLLNITGASIGRVCVVPDAICPANVNQHVCIIRCDDSLHPEYVAALLSSPKFQSHIWESQAGGTRQALTKQMIENFEIPWVLIEKQRQIATRLKTQLTEVDKARQAAEAQLRDEGLFISRYHENAIEQLDGASRVPLGELLHGIEAGKSFQTTELIARPDELGVLKVSAVSWNEFLPQEAKAIEGEYQPDERHRVKKGDLIISRANTLELVGAVVRANDDYPMRLLSDKTLRLVVDEEKVLPDYLLTILKLPEARTHIENNATGTSDSMRNISQKTINAIPVPVISIDKQKELVERFSLFNREMLLIEKSTNKMLNDINLLPQKILARAFEM